MSDATKKIMEQAKLQVRDQSMSVESQTKAQAAMMEETAKHDTNEAAQLCEDAIAWLKGEVTERALSPEQLFFAISLVTINIRNHFPTEKGGKELFDACSKRAWDYYERNK